MPGHLKFRHNNQKSFFTQNFERLASSTFAGPTATPQLEAERSKGLKRNPKQNNPVRPNPPEQKYLERFASKSRRPPEKLSVAKCKLRAYSSSPKVSAKSQDLILTMCLNLKPKTEELMKMSKLLQNKI